MNSQPLGNCKSISFSPCLKYSTILGPSPWRYGGLKVTIPDFGWRDLGCRPGLINVICYFHCASPVKSSNQSQWTVKEEKMVKGNLKGLAFHLDGIAILLLFSYFRDPAPCKPHGLGANFWYLFPVPCGKLLQLHVYNWFKMWMKVILAVMCTEFFSGLILTTAQVVHITARITFTSLSTVQICDFHIFLTI